MGEGAPGWARVLHQDLRGMRSEAVTQASEITGRLGDVVSAVQGMSDQVGALARAMEIHFEVPEVVEHRKQPRERGGVVRLELLEGFHLVDVVGQMDLGRSRPRRLARAPCRRGRSAGCARLRCAGIRSLGRG